MKKIIIGAVLVSCVLLNGCVSGYVNSVTKSNMSATRGGEEVSTWDAVKEAPLSHAGAVLADIGIIYGGAEGVRWISEKNEEPKNVRESEQTAGRDNVSVEINGDYNTVEVSGDSTVTTTPAPVVSE